MRKILLGAVFLAVFVIILVARLPLSLAAEGLPAAVTYRSVTGTLWDGRVSGLTVGDQRIGDLDVRIGFLPLLTRTFSARLDAEGRALAGSAKVSYGAGRVTVSDGRGRVDLAPFDLYDAFDRGVRGTVDFTIERLVLTEEGCEEATLQVSTDAMGYSLEAFAPGGLVLEGEGRCDDGDLVIPLKGELSGHRVEAGLRVAPSGRYVTTLSVEPAAPAFGTLLERAGFERRGDRFVTELSGHVETTL